MFWLVGWFVSCLRRRNCCRRCCCCAVCGKVDEEGTEAAAVTVFNLGPTAAPGRALLASMAATALQQLLCRKMCGQPTALHAFVYHHAARQLLPSSACTTRGNIRICKLVLAAWTAASPVLPCRPLSLLWLGWCSGWGTAAQQLLLMLPCASCQSESILGYNVALLHLQRCWRSTGRLCSWCMTRSRRQ